MKISIVIPLYNKEKHIQRAIKSVLSQTCQDFELIVVDDGSTDGSYEAAYALQDPRICIIRQENRGVSLARNLGVADSKHELVAFLDADDEWLPNYLERMLKLLDKYPDCGIYGSACFRFDGSNTYKFLTSITGLPFGWDGVFENYFEYVDHIIPYHTSSVIVSKTAFQNIGGFDKQFKCWQDTDVWMQLAMIFRGSYLNVPLSIYHLDANDMGSKKFNTSEELNDLLQKWKLLLVENKVPEKFHDSFQEFLSRYRIMYARNCLSKGSVSEARRILLEIEPNSKYYSQGKVLLRRSNFPSVFLKGILFSYSLLKSICNKIESYLGLN